MNRGVAKYMRRNSEFIPAQMDLHTWLVMHCVKLAVNVFLSGSRPSPPMTAPRERRTFDHIEAHSRKPDLTWPRYLRPLGHSAVGS